MLIDADNTSPAIVGGLFEAVAKYGVATIKRIYGDWTCPDLSGWKKVLLDHSIHSVQQFAYTKGKNATDSSLIIDSMDLLYTRRFNGFCLVSSDSDFTRLASRLREEGLAVYGFGEEKTPKPFMAACDEFIYTESFRAKGPLVMPGRRNHGLAANNATGLADTSNGGSPEPRMENPADLIAQILDDVADQDGWSHLSLLRMGIAKLNPQFDPKAYGYKKLNHLLRGHPLMFELRIRKTTCATLAGLYVRRKRLS